MTNQPKTVGVLTGGGDAPGLNAAICGLSRRLLAAGCSLRGFRYGWRGLIEDESIELAPIIEHELLTRGGTILGSSSASPYRDPGRDVPKVKATFAKHGLDALVAIGGDGTLRAADSLVKDEGLPIVAVPKTIDNDLSATDFTFGFVTAVERATQCMDDLRTTAESHDRLLVVECMGRHTGWIAAYAGVAAAAESILVPERPVQIDTLCEKLQRLRDSGERAAIVSVAEGTRVFNGETCLTSTDRDEFGELCIGGVGNLLAQQIQQRLGWESRAMVLGHLQRAGAPLAFDRILALRYGARAARLVLEERFGRMAAMHGGRVTDVPIADAVADWKRLDPHFLDRYEDFFLPVAL